MYVPTFIIGSAVPINAILHYFFIFSNWSPLPNEIAYIGSAFSIAITFLYMSIVGFLYIKYVRGKECWGGVDFRCIFDFKKWIEFLNLGKPYLSVFLLKYLIYYVLIKKYFNAH